MKGVVDAVASLTPELPKDAALAQTIKLDSLAVREEMERVLASHHFQTSKRCQAFLRYAIEQTLSGQQDLKERSIGVEVFGRSPSYDTNLDPVVRMTAGEVRKRLALYYQDGPDSEMRMELPVGSYVPRFTPHREYRQGHAPRHVPEREVTASTGVEKFGLVDEGSVTASMLDTRPARSKRWLIAICSVAIASVAGAIGWSVMQHRSHPQQTPIDQFWSPFLASPNPIHISIGIIHPAFAQVEPNQLRSSISGPMILGKKTGYPRQVPVTVLGDGIAMAEIAALLKSHGQQFSIHPESSTSFDDLQQGPSVLIGAFNNDWSIMLTHPLRFYFDLDESKVATWIADRNQPGVKIGLIPPGGTVATMKEDYGVVVRMYDTRTKQLVVIAAGLTPFGTQAAGKFVTDPTSIAELSKRLPSSWPQRNIEVLIKTDLIDGEVGPPQIVATNLW